MKALISIALLAVAAASFAQSTIPTTPPTSVAAGTQWAASEFFGYKQAPASILEYKLKTFTGFFGKPTYSLDLYSFVGATTNSQTPIGGFLLGKSFTLANGIGFTAGAGGNYDGKTFRAGLAAGITVQF